LATTITTTVADDASPFRVTLTPREGFNPLFQINDGSQFDTAWIPELIDLLEQARKLANANEVAPMNPVPKKKKHGPKI
jgi:hypothetical protein